MQKDLHTPDEVLLRRIAEGDDLALEELFQKYSTVVKICARPYFLAGGDGEDLIQEGMFGLLSAVRTYDPSKDVRFRTYAEHCIRRRLYSAIRAASSSKHSPLNNHIPLEIPALDENNTQGTYILRDPEELLIARERVGELRHRLVSRLSSLERKVLALNLKGMKYEDMAAELNTTTKSVDNAVQRIRRKLAELINAGDNQ